MGEEIAQDAVGRQQQVKAELQQIRQAKQARAAPAFSKPVRPRPWEQADLGQAHEEESWLTTYLDMMTLLLVLMIVMLSFAGKRAADLGTQQGGQSAVVQPGGSGVLPGGTGLFPQAGTGMAADAGRDHGVLLDGLGDDIDVLVNEQSIRFRINSEILFGSGQADLSREGLQLMGKVADIMARLPYQVAVQGHTDSVPIRSHRFPSNWELSGARAGSVVRYLQANGVGSERLRAIGYADTRPLADNTQAQGRAANRRVELIMEKIPAQAADSHQAQLPGQP